MSNIVEYILKLKSYLSKDLVNEARAAQRSFNGIDKAAAHTQKQITDTLKPQKLKIDVSDVEKAQSSVKSLKGTIDNLGNSTQRTFGSGGKGGLFGSIFSGAALGNMAAQAATMAIHKAIEVGTSALEQGMNAERNIVGLSTFVGDKKANQIYSQLQQQAIYTPFTSAQLLNVERGMLPYISPNKANRTTLALANAVAAVGGSDFTLERMAWHMQQMSAQGKMEGIQAREFGFAGIPIYKLLADAYLPNMDSAKAQEKLKNTTITFDMVATALDHAQQKGGMFAGAMEKLSQTIYGKWTTIKDFWQLGEQKLTLSQSDNIKKLEDMAINFLQKIPEWVSELSPKITQAFEWVKDILPDVKDHFVALMHSLAPIGNLMLSQDMKDLSKNVLVLSTELINDLIPALKTIAPIFKELAAILAPIVDTLSKTIQGTREMVDVQQNYNDVKAFADSTNAAYNTPGINKAALDSAASAGGWDAQRSYWENFMRQQQNTPEARMMRDKMRKTAYLVPGLVGPDGIISNTRTPYMPGFVPDNEGKSGKGSNPLADSMDNITGGGKRQIIINVNKSFVENFSIHAQKVEEGYDKLKERVGQIFLEIVNSGAVAV